MIFIGHYLSRFLWVGFIHVCLIGVVPALANHKVPLFLSFEDEAHQGFVRIINHSARPGEVRIEVIDDAGVRFDPFTLHIGTNQVIHFRSEDLGYGNQSMGLSGGIGPSQGDWRIELSSTLDIEVLSYIRTADGFLTSMHDTVPVAKDGRYRVAFFNADSEFNQESWLRLINAGKSNANLTITGIDDSGESAGGEVTVMVAAGTSQTLTAQELQSGGAGFQGKLGGQEESWQFFVTADQPVTVLSLLRSQTGHLVNQSTALAHAEDVQTVPLFSSAADPLGRQGFMRVINHSAEAGEVVINAYDDSPWDYGAVTLSLDPYEVVQLNSYDLELGNNTKGLYGALGAGYGDWRLALSSDLDIEVMSYVRVMPVGYSAPMHDTVTDARGRYRVAIFNPADHLEVTSWLRLVNTGADAAQVTITGVDDSGASPGGEVTLLVEAGATRTLTAGELESGGAEIDGALGDGKGMWQLLVESEQPIMVMNLLVDSAGYLANLSTVPAILAPQNGTAFDDRVVGKRIMGDDPANYTEFVSQGRYRQTEGTHIYNGSYTYTNSGETTGTVVFSADSGVSGTTNLTFESRTTGRMSFTGATGGEPRESSWYLVAAEDDSVTVLEGLTISAGRVQFAFTNASGCINLNGSSTIGVTYTTHSSKWQRRNDSESTWEDIAGTEQQSGICAFDPTSPGEFRIFIDITRNGTRRTYTSANTIVIEQSVGVPDLFLSSASTSETDLTPGASFTLSATVRNDGDGASVGTALRYYLSDDSIISTADIKVGTEMAGSLASSSTSNHSIVLIAPSSPGTYYYGACLEVVAGESNTTNNCLSGVTVTVTTAGDSDSAATYFDLDSDNGNPRGIAHSGDRFHVVDSINDKVYAYTTTGQRVANADFDLDGDNGHPEGIAHVDGKLYVVDIIDDKVYAYTATGMRDAGADFDLDPDNGESQGITHLDGRFYVVDWRDDKVYVYMKTGQRVANADFDLDGDNSYETGITHLDGRIYVVDLVDDKAYAYTTTGQRDAAADLDLDEDNDSARGIVSVNDDLYIVDWQLNRVFSYSGSGETPSNSYDVGDTITTLPEGVWNPDVTSGGSVTVTGGVVMISLDNGGYIEEGRVLYTCKHADGCEINNGVVQRGKIIETPVSPPSPNPTDLTVRSTSVSDSNLSPGGSFALRVSVGNYGGEESTATTLHYYRSDDSSISTADSEVGTEAVSALAGSSTSNHSIVLIAPSSPGTYYYGACLEVVAGESNTTNNCSSGVTVTVTTAGDSDGAATYFDLDSDNGNPRGIAHSGDRFHVVDSIDDKVYAYTTTGQRVANADFDLDGDNGHPEGIAHVDGKLYVVDIIDDKVYAYTATGIRDAGADFDLDPDNGESQGITHLDGRFYVVDWRDDKVYVYMKTGQRVANADFDLDGDNSYETGITHLDGRIYVVDLVDDKAYAYTTTGQRDAAADLDLDEDNDSARGIVSVNDDLYIVDWQLNRVFSYSGSGETPSNSYDVGDTITTLPEGVWNPDVTSGGSVTVTGGVVMISLDNGGYIEEGRVLYTCKHADGCEINNGVVQRGKIIETPVSPPSPNPTDLTVRSTSVSDSNLSPGGSFALRVSVGNYGGEESTATTLHYYRSDDSSISTADSEVGTEAVSALAGSSTSNHSIVLIAPSSPGTYYYGACLEVVAGESNTTNNCSSGVTVTVTTAGDSDGAATYFDLDSDNGNPRGIAHSGDRFHVVDSIDDKVYAYTTTGQRVANADFDLDGDNGHPEGIAHVDGKLYVVDIIDDKVYAYTATGIRDAGADFDLDPDNGESQGITHLDGRFYVVDWRDDKVYVYMKTGQRVANADFDLDGDNSYETGITHLDGRIYVVDLVDDKAYAYTTTGQRDAAADLDLYEDNDSARGIVSVNDDLYIVDWQLNRVFRYSDTSPSFNTTDNPGNQFHTVGTAIDTLTLPEANGGNGILIYSLSPTVPGLTFNVTTRQISGTPTMAASYNMTYVVADENGDTDMLTFRIIVDEAGQVAPLYFSGCANGRYIDDPDSNPTLVDDCLALVGFANSFAKSGELSDSHVLRQWGVDDQENLGSWAGIEINEGRVTTIRLSSSQLKGAIPPELGQLTELTILVLSVNELTGAIPSEFGGLAKLTHLDLYWNKITDISPLAGLTNLTLLNLRANFIEDISPLSGLTGLETLDLYFNKITDISPLIGLTNLSYLNLAFNRIADISPLTGLTNLYQLDLKGNRIADVSPLAGLTRLRSLEVGINHIVDISPLAGLTNLTWLWLSENAISDISPLTRLTSLTALSLGRTRIKDLAPLTGLTELTELYLYDNEITDISPLAGLTNLTRLGLNNNRITDISPLAGLTKLTWLELDNNGLMDISSMSGLTNLTRLHLNDNEITDISPLAGLTKLTWLNLNDNVIADLSPLTELIDLTFLDLTGNSIKDVSPLLSIEGLGSGTEILLDDNPLSGESIDIHIPALTSRGVRVSHPIRLVDEFPDSRLTLVYNDNVIVMQVDEDVDSSEVFNKLDAYASEFYEWFDDEFDYLFFLSNLSIEETIEFGVSGVYFSVMNDTEGIGKSKFFNSLYGSAGQLRGVIHLSGYYALRGGPSLHELMHAWANFTVSTSFGPHWGFSSANGQLGGFDIDKLEDLGGGRWTAGNFATVGNNQRQPPIPYSPIELYFAGMVPPEDVPDLWLAEDGEWLKDENGAPVRTSNGDNIFTADNIRTVSIDDIIAEHGKRDPSMSERPHQRAAVILLIDDDNLPNTTILQTVSEHATWLGLQGDGGIPRFINYYEATGGRATLTLDGLAGLRKSIKSTPAKLPSSFGVPSPPVITTTH